MLALVSMPKLVWLVSASMLVSHVKLLICAMLHGIVMTPFGWPAVASSLGCLGFGGAAPLPPPCPPKTSSRQAPWLRPLAPPQAPLWTRSSPLCFPRWLAALARRLCALLAWIFRSLSSVPLAVVAAFRIWWAEAARLSPHMLQRRAIIPRSRMALLALFVGAARLSTPVPSAPRLALGPFSCPRRLAPLDP